MAYAVLVSLEQTIDQILNHDRYSTTPQEKRLIISLDKYVVSLQSFLEDYPEKAQNLEGKIRDAASEAEDMIECFMLDQTLLCFGYEAVMMRTDEQDKIKFGHKLERVAKKMESIVASVVKMNNSIFMKDEQLIDSSSIASSSSGVGNNDMVGFDDNLMEMKSRLMGESRRLQFLSIVGMGGIGKTTLAKNAYDDRSIQEYFQIRAWVTVSQDYRAREILSSLLHAMEEFCPVQTNEFKSIDEMSEIVYKILKGRRYMIVMDDMWSTKVLDDVRKLFPDDGNRSRIMLTTRLYDVASYADSISPYEMRLMDENQSWNLFRQKAFPHHDGAPPPPPPELEIIGKEIARNCKGLPLAIVVIAGVLSAMTDTPALWWAIAWNITHSVGSKDERLDKILLLSYNHLPHRLRPCLLYMGLFREDTTIRVSELIKLWIAEGFLKHPNEPKTLEEGAEEHLEDLVRRNLILVTERKSNGKIKSCSLHDVVRDTCLRLLEKENCLRHVMAYNSFQNTKESVSIRSMLSYSSIEGIKQYKLLRVLQAPDCTYRFELPPWEILKLLHLRYLSISTHKIPSAITNFENLQTLVINKSFDLELPSSLWQMQQLRHLLFRSRLPHPEGASLALGNLQTLKEVFDKERHAYLLERIPNLKKLGLFYGPEDSCGGLLLNKSLIYLCKLEKLKIRFEFVHDSFYAIFPCSLKKCTLHGCKLSRRFLKAIGSLPNLEVLKLMFCTLGLTSSWIICSDEFPLLKVLMIQSLNVMDLAIEDSSALPRLEYLLLRHCNNLRNISDDFGEIPTLELIEVKFCGKAVYEWAKRMEEEQRSYGNDTLQVRCIGQ